MDGLRFGALSPGIREQLDEAEIEYDETKLEHCQRDSYAITRLHVRGLLTDSQADAVRRKLVKKIEEAVGAR